MFLASQVNEFLIIAIIAIMIIAVGLLIYYVVTGRKKKNEDVQIKPNFETRPVAQPEVVQNEWEVQNDVPIQSQEIVEEQVPAQPLVEETASQKAEEDAKTDNSIQTLLNQMQQDLDNSNNDSYADSITRYEDDEEANAIISYKELMKFKEKSDKDIVLEDKKQEEIKEFIEKKEEPTEEVKKFKRSEFISPIFGYNEDTNVTYHEIKRPPRKETPKPNKSDEWESDHMLKELENDAAEVIEFENKEEKSTEIDKNDSFLEALVDFRNKLN